MNSKSFRYSLILLMALIAFGCNKDFSHESGTYGLATGTLTDSLGNCGNNTEVIGDYMVNTPLLDNYVRATVHFTQKGRYVISSDTVNGIWFVDSGFVSTAGDSRIKLRGRGTPIANGTDYFRFHFGNSTCGFSVTTSASGSSVNNGSNTTDYLPTTSGGWIRYNVSPAFTLLNGNSLDTFRSSISSQTIPLNSKYYTLYETAPFNDGILYNKGSNGEYYCMGTPEFDYLYVYDSIINNQSLEYIYLKDAVPAGTSWNSSSIRAGIFNTTSNSMAFGQARLKFTVIAVNETLTRIGISFANVIHIKREMEFLPDGSTTGAYESIFVADVYYAKGIGLIEEKVYKPNNTATILQTITISGFKGL